MTTNETVDRRRYEFRVWGRQQSACQRLSILADRQRYERVDDCYLLLGDHSCNAKIRGNRLKVKRLVEVRSGFQRWDREWARDGATPPEPLDQLLAAVGHRPAADSSQLLAVTAAGLQRQLGIQAVFVTKRRQRFRLGGVRAEATTVEVLGRPGRLQTMAIEGRDLEALIGLRATLGLAGRPNVALHHAVETLASR